MANDLAQKQLQQACTALAESLRRGHAARAESWLQSCPGVAEDSDLAVELIYSEFVSREALGDPPSPSEYYERFPAHADRLRRMFDVDEMLHGGSTANDAPTSPAVARSASIPKTVGAYEIVERVGGGGMGVVYRARQTKPHREVALKLLKSGEDAAVVELARFRREAEAAARLSHPNIVTVYEVGEADAVPYLAMEYVAGGDLRAKLAGKPQPAEWSAELLSTLARAVAEAHSQGVVHRDLKPANILLASNGVPKITDFGLAAVAGSNDGLTKTGQILGTLAYLAPEQAKGGEAASRPAADLYSLGAILYECLTGRPPLVAETDAEAVRMLQSTDPVPPRKLRPSLPRDLETICMKCLRKEPQRRYADAKELADDLDRFRRNEPIRARPVGLFERARLWAKRKPSQAALVGVSLTAAIAIVFVVITYTARLKESLAEEDAQRRRAEEQVAEKQAAIEAEQQRREQARAALDQWTEHLLEEGTQSARSTAEQISSLEAALKSYDDLTRGAKNDEASRMTAAAAAWRAANLAGKLNRAETAETMIEKSLAAWKSLMKDFPQNFTCFRGYAIALAERGRMRAQQKKYSEAAKDHYESIQLQQKYPASNGTTQAVQLTATINNLASAYFKLKDAARGTEAESKAIELCEANFTKQPQERLFRDALASSLQSRALRQISTGAPEKLEPDIKRAIELRMLDGKLSPSPHAMDSQAEAHLMLARLAGQRSQTVDATREYANALEIREKLFMDHPSGNNYHHALYRLIGFLNGAAGRYISEAELERLYARCRPQFEARAVLDNDADLRLYAGGTACDHGRLLLKQNRSADALKAYDSAESILRTLLKQKPNHEIGKLFLVNTLAGRASTLSQATRHAEAAKVWEEALKLDHSPRRPIFATDWAFSLARAGDCPGAMKVLAAEKAEGNKIAFMRAHAYAIVVTKSDDAALRDEAEKNCLEWLGKARTAGDLNDPQLQTQIRRSPEWAGMRNRHKADALLLGEMN